MGANGINDKAAPTSAALSDLSEITLGIPPWLLFEHDLFETGIHFSGSCSRLMRGKTGRILLHHGFRNIDRLRRSFLPDDRFRLAH